MATIRLIKKSEIKGQPATLYMRFKEGRKIDLVVITPIKVYPEYWNNETGKFKQRIVNDEVFTKDYQNKIEG